MPRKKRASSPMELYDDDFDEDASSQSSQPPVQRNAANARERMRMRVLSSAYGRLKTKLPNIPPDTKLSKLDTLRLATLYIKQLITEVETGGSGSAASHAQPHAHGSGGHAGMLDTRSHGVDCGNATAGSSATPFSFHNAGHLGMSWPFEFHQNLQSSAHQRNSNQIAFGSARMDWQSAQTPVAYAKAPRNEAPLPTGDGNYAQLQDTHWYPSEMGMQLELEQSRGGNGCCAYESAGVAQHQRGLAIATSQAHSL
ncbi:hypothetical protein KR222_008352 [Zaprionus bogoriensis]|nr:hypothetical protein KR222_008352 [Zaprionus bogoriensis]